jgi:hypothetical protein
MKKQRGIFTQIDMQLGKQSESDARFRGSKESRIVNQNRF